MDRLQIVLDPIVNANAPFVFTPRDGLNAGTFLQLCLANPELRFERTALGEVIVLPPAYSRTSHQNLRIARQIDAWAEEDGTGVAFGPDAGFELPNGANRSPDASWVRLSRVEALELGATPRFLPLCPDFVVELRSESDTLRQQQEKMREYMDNGAQLGWLVDPVKAQVFVYQPDGSVQRLDRPMALTGEPLLPGLIVKLGTVWSPKI